MHSKKYSLAKYLLVPLIAYFFYWAIWVEIGMYQKPIQDAFVSAYPNWIGFISLSLLEAAIIVREGKSKDQTAISKSKMSEKSPWEAPQKKEVDPDSLKRFMHRSVEAWDDRFQKTFDSIGKTTIHKHLFLKLKRISYGVCFILYIAMALLSLNNIPFLILFILTAYAFLENLLWARHYSWARQKRDERSRT